MKRIFAAFLMVLAGLSPARAEDLALIVSNDFYQHQPRVADADRIQALEYNLRQAGFVVRRVSNSRSNFSESGGRELSRMLDEADRLVVVISGHVVRAFGQNWLLHTDAVEPNVFTIGRAALPLRPFFAAAADRPGDAVIAVAAPDAGLTLGPGIQRGFRADAIPQGVTVVSGPPAPVAGFIAGDLLRPGLPLASAVASAPRGVEVQGYIPISRGFLTGGSVDLGRIVGLEQSLWRLAQLLDSLDGYREYLDRFPNGDFAFQARQRVQALSITPEERARLDEQALGLSRNQRRAIQRGLTLLGFDTGGVDGILGRRSRGAIAAWQRSIGVPDTGYLTANQITRIESAAAIRAEELRIEAERRRLEEERRDRDFWSQTGALDTEEGLRAYLGRYPDGLYSDQAEARLKQIEREQRRLAQKAEREAWDKAVMQGTVASYGAYLQAYPNGRFAEEARARIAALRNPETPPDVIAAAKAEESRMNLTAVTRHLIEAQLHKLQLQPGNVDGRFDRQTRRALRRFQRANSMPVTGFVTRATIVRLLASAVER